MSRYSILSGFAYNTAQQFAASANYYACMAWRRGEPDITIDLLDYRIEPVVFSIPRSRNLVWICARGLKRRVRNSAPVPAVLTEAELEVTFDLSGTGDPKEGADPPYSLPAHFFVRLKDERGRDHVGTLDRSVGVSC